MKKMMLFLLLMTAIIMPFIFPQLLINQYVLKKVNTFFFPQANIDWAKTDIIVSSESLFDKVIIFDASDSCLDYKPHTLCFDQLSGAIKISLGLKFSWSIKKLSVEDQSIKWVTQKQKSNPILINDLLRNVRSDAQAIFPYLDDIKLNLDNSFLLNDEHQTQIIAKINAEGINLSFINEDLNTEIELKKKNKKFQGNLKLKKDKHIITSSIDLTVDENLQLDLGLRYRLPSGQDLSLTSIMRLGNESFVFKLKDFKVNWKSIDSFVSIAQCTSHFHLLKDENVIFSCQNIALKTTKLKNYKMIQKNNNRPFFELIFNAKLNIFNEIRFDEKNYRWDELDMSGGHNSKVWNLDFKLSSDLILNKERFTYRAVGINWDLKIKSFENVVSLLKDSGFEIPAPLNSLKGELLFSSNQIPKEDSSVFSIPFKVDSRLVGAANKLGFMAHGQFDYSRSKSKKSFLKLDVELDQLHLYIPEIDPIRGIPPLTKNNNIYQEKKEIKKKRTKSNLDYKIKISNKSRQPVRIYYYLFGPYLALDVDMELKPKKNIYNLASSKEMTITYLKREISLINLKLNEKKKESLDVKLRYTKSGHDIFLNIIGSPQEPELLLSSLPSLSRDDIISVLIYGRIANGLSSFEKQSVGGTEAAIADRALGLFSIWAFASTPIESVYYNPATQSYSAQIALLDGMNLTIGSDWEKGNTLSLRKRINKTWSLVTSYYPGEIDAGTSGDLLLQKEFYFE